MKVKRQYKIEAKTFKLGDIITFTLTTGEQVEALAVRKTPEGMLFITVDCLKDMQPVFKDTEGMEDEDFSYDNSDLRKVLNGAILASFPAEIRDRMKVVYGDSDLLRIPSEKEIFGENKYGQKEGKVKQFKCMKNRRNRIAFQGSKAIGFGWYWLMNRHKEYAYHFALIVSTGSTDFDNASYSNGVRPVFLLSE